MSPYELKLKENRTRPKEHIVDAERQICASTISSASVLRESVNLEQGPFPSPLSVSNLSRWIRLPSFVHPLAAQTPGSILLETSRFDTTNRYSYLFMEPESVLTAYKLHEIQQVFAGMEQALQSGMYVAGIFSYEAGGFFEDLPHLRSAENTFPLIWLGVYNMPFVFDHAQGCFVGRGPMPPEESNDVPNHTAIPEPLMLRIAEDEYLAKLEKIKEYIAAGETYQVNFTDKMIFPSTISPAALFEHLSRQQSVAYSALMNIADHHILSLSPELFFRIENEKEGRKITTRPMKGTISRGLDIFEDAQMALRLQQDIKNRSEHVMIVDLLRNDLGRICNTGSIHVDDLFSVEKYETLLQMTSTISGTLKPGVNYYEIFQSMFPSGSVTGAPKIRTMQIIRELEQSPRGIYTGAIGFASPQGPSVFNVAIRTLVMKNGAATLGVGGGIVADSVPEDEYKECLLKAAFLTRQRHDFQLIETMLWEKDFFLLSMHLDRMESSAAYFNFAFDRERIESNLLKLAPSFEADKRYKVRLLLAANGDLNFESTELPTESWTGKIKLCSQRTSSTNVFFRHKTTLRELYNDEYSKARASGLDEVLFLNELDQLTEGATTNLFIEKDGRLFTPPLVCGVLPGILRRHLLKTFLTAEEKVLTVADLRSADVIFLCNSVRGMLRVNSLLL